jgi:F5/8 type C domain.
VELQEFIALGQRVKAFSVSVLDGKEYREIANETTIGYKRILRLPNTTTKSVRISILDAKASPVISEVKLFKAPELLADPVIKRDKAGMVTISSASTDPVFYYTLNGTEPTMASAKFTKAFSFPQSGTIKAKAFIEGGKKSGATVTTTLDLAPTAWTSDAEKAIDGDPRSFWASKEGYPQEVLVDMGTATKVSGFTYTPRERGGIIYTYEFYLSQDGKNWGAPVAKGNFANILNSPVKQTVKLSQAAQAKYFKLVAVAPADEKETRAVVAEVGVF